MQPGTLLRPALITSTGKEGPPAEMIFSEPVMLRDELETIDQNQANPKRGYIDQGEHWRYSRPGLALNSRD